MAGMQKPLFAIFQPQAGMDFDDLLGRAHMAERLGYHSLWLVDHMWSLAAPERDHHECLALMAALLARTERLRIGTLVICALYRNPALLAKALCTLDHIGGGRLEFGLGAGWMRQEFAAYGYEYPPVPVRLKRLEETLAIIKAMFGPDKASSVTGDYHSINGAYNFPKPLQRPHPPITIGGSGKKVMLRLVAQYADRWNIPAGYQDLDDLIATLRSHCARAGRDFGSIEISEQVMVCLGRDQAEVDEKWQAARRMRPLAATAIAGTPAQVTDALRQRLVKGITTFTILFSDPEPTMMERFAADVMPALV